MYSAISLKYYETFRSSSISAAEMGRAISVFLVEALAETKKLKSHGPFKNLLVEALAETNKFNISHECEARV